MPSFSGVTFILFCFVVVFFISMNSRPLVQSFFDMHTPRQPYMFLPFFLFSISVSLEMSLFSTLFVPLSFYLCMESTSYVFLFRVLFFYLGIMGCCFYISILCDNLINQQIKSGD